MLLEEVKTYCTNLSIPYRETDAGIRANMKKPSAEGAIELTFYAETNTQEELHFSVGGRSIEYKGTNWETARNMLYIQKEVWYDD